ncbi:MAG: RimK family alpha-L-glutamate ligase [Candidatus Hermodarchaeota archaeon]
MVKKIIFSATHDHIVIKHVIKELKKAKEFNLMLHDPTKDFFNLSNMPKSFTDADIIIVKVRNECSLDILHFAKIYNIPTLHDIDTILMCKNKIALDFALRRVINYYLKDLKKFLVPDSWIQTLINVNRFKKWALDKLPIVIKSHYQHDKYNRFNFLVQKIEEVDKFCKKYKQFLYYNVYIQEFIECDGIERKVYVIGDKVFGIKRENPIYLYLREKPEDIDVDLIEREQFKITKEIINLSRILSKELKLKIFGFDLVQPINNDKLYIIDLNDFPSFKGIPNIEKELTEYLKNYVLEF